MQGNYSPNHHHMTTAFKPLCLTEYFALQHDCGPKAILNTPMADSFYQHAAQWQHSTGASNKETPGDGEQGTRGKQNLVLYDPDDLGHFDPSLVKVCHHERLQRCLMGGNACSVLL